MRLSCDERQNFMLALIFILISLAPAIAGNPAFNPYTGEYVDGRVSAYDAARIQQFKRARYDQALSWMRRHYVPGHTVMTDRGDMIITENGVQRVEVNPYQDHTYVHP
jgi:hypothetical protein